MVKRVLPTEAAELLQQGWVYLDVRSVPEFDQGHPAGALNIPLLHVQGGRMAPNADFQRVLDGYACPECLAKFKWARNDCPLCPWERDLTEDIIDQVPPEWLPGPATVTNDN